MLDTQETSILFLSLHGKIKNIKDPLIGVVVIIISLCIWIIITSSGMNQISNISFRINHQSLTLQVVNEKYLVVHMVKNQVNLNDDTIWVDDESYVDTFYVL